MRVLACLQSTLEEREHLQVYLRVRPFTPAEGNGGESQDCVSIQPPDSVLLKPPGSSLSARLSCDRSLPQTGQHFQFSQVYGPETTQRELFDGTVKDLVRDVLEGGNSLVFTYGVTNAGKTFTFLGPDADAGILPRSLGMIFRSIEERIFTETTVKPHRCGEFTRLTQEQQAEVATHKRNLLRQLKESERSCASQAGPTSKTPLEGSMLSTTVLAEDAISLEVEAHTKFSVWVSFCEIYNENIHDLLETTVPSGALRRTALRLSQDVKGNAFVKGLNGCLELSEGLR
ncbi:kinesin-like protein KIF20B [Genypterus blacodes]|uniref:kinesin-like protein KIF20B n=1 Tax=Genypterus blacodes TaxID=154954 RepID=UPI003F770ECB